VKIRPATVADAPSLAALAREGFETFQPFAPPTFEPPSLDLETATFREQLSTTLYWCRLAEDDEAPVGVAGFRRQEVEPGLVHFQRLFVSQRLWGTGLAAELLRLATEQMENDRFLLARLFTPAGQARARRFYEREGWRQSAEPYAEPRFGGLELVEYRRELSVP
jgi:GNAT superfamily N-acetyltransferase